MRGRELYISLCREMDNILIMSGVKKICIKCSTVKLYKHKFSDSWIDRWFNGRGKGCCNDCDYLSKSGCTTDSLWCKLWLCSPKLKGKIKKAGYLKRFEKIKQIAKDNKWYLYRKGVDDLFKGG